MTGRRWFLVTALLVASLAVGWLGLTVADRPAWLVSVKASRDPEATQFWAQPIGQARRPLAGPSGPAAWHARGRTWVLFLPEPMSALESDWYLKLEFMPGAAGTASILLNGSILVERHEAPRALRLTIPAERLRPDNNTLELRGSEPRQFRLLRVRNYVAAQEWFPGTCILARRQPYVRPTDGPQRLALGIGLAAAALVWGAVIGLGRTAGGTPVWTIGQAGRTVGLWASVIAVLALVNVAAPYKLLVPGWAFVVTAAVYFAIGGVLCAWRNIKALAWPRLSEPQRIRWLERRRAVLLFATLWFLYNCNMTRLNMADCEPTARMAISFIRHGDFDLDEYRDYHNDFTLRKVGSHWVSRWTPGAAVFCIPFFLLPVWFGVDAPSPAVDMLMKLVASTLTALSAVLLYYALLRLCSRRGALWLTVMYALGTACFSISSQDIWQHAPGQVCLATAMVLVLRPTPGRWAHVWTGFFLAMAVVCRPNMALFGGALALWAAGRHGLRSWFWYGLGALAPAVGMIAYNLHYFGTPRFAGYEGIVSGTWGELAQWPVGFVGFLVSPNRGLFVYSPVLLMMIYGMGRGLRHPDRLWRALAGLVTAAVLAYLLMMGAWKTWHGMFTFGSRYSADVVLFWALGGAFGIDRILERAAWRRVFIGLLALSIAIQSLGVYVNTHEWNWMQWRRLGLTREDSSASAWTLRDPQILWQVRHLLGLTKQEVHPDW